MIRAGQLSVSFGPREILHNLTFTIASGEKVGLVGGNGAGKTTLLRVLIGELEPDSGLVRISRGSRLSYVPQYLSLNSTKPGASVRSYMLEGKELAIISEKLSRTTALLETETDQTKWDKLYRDYERLLARFNEGGGPSAESDIATILKGLGLAEVSLDQSVQNLSGGQKTRLVLARMLFENNNVLLMDEPTNHVDEAAANWLGKYLAKSRKTVVVVSHSQQFLDKVARRIFYLDQGKLTVYPGNYTRFLALQAQGRTSTERVATRVTREIARTKRIIGGLSQSRSGLKHQLEKKVSRMQKGLPRSKRARKLSFQFPAGAELRSTVLLASNIGQSYGPKPVFHHISFEIRPHDRVAILGENGAGKTTLLCTIAGQLPPSQGKINLNPRASVGWYRQEQENLDDDLTVLEEAKRSGVSSPQLLRDSLAHFLFPGDRVEQRVGNLSRGERARLAICKIMLEAPNLLLLDEPTNHLDQQARESLIGALVNFKGAIIVVAHDDDFLKKIGVQWGIQMPQGIFVRLD